MFKNLVANGELSHLEGHGDDGFDVPNVDLPRHVQSTTCAALHHVSRSVALLGVD